MTDQIDPSLINIIGDLVEGRRPWPLFLHGKPGIGKTCIGLWMTDYVYSAVYALIGDLGRKWAAGHQKYKPEYVRFGEWFSRRTVGLLVIDEIGAVPTEEASADEYNAFKEVLDIRERTPLVLISNLDLKAVTQVYDERIASRCAAGTIVEMKGDDRRIVRRRR